MFLARHPSRPHQRPTSLAAGVPWNLGSVESVDRSGLVVTWNMAETWLKLSLLRKRWRENDWKLDLRWYDEMWSSSLLFFSNSLDLKMDHPICTFNHSWGQNPHRCPQLWTVISQIPHGIYKTIVIICHNIGYKTIEVGHQDRFSHGKTGTSPVSWKKQTTWITMVLYPRMTVTAPARIVSFIYSNRLGQTHTKKTVCTRLTAPGSMFQPEIGDLM